MFIQKGIHAWHHSPNSSQSANTQGSFTKHRGFSTRVMDLHPIHTCFTLTLPKQLIISCLSSVMQPGVMSVRKSLDHITINSASVRGLQTNIRDLTKSYDPSQLGHRCVG